ncbi:MAG: hypothetical protein HYU28_00360 [Actinobacteria bacterium]|nr:hypothetical protein [Actinomycetota bacterium]
MGALHDLYDRHEDRVAFLVVYVREAHPEDGWVVTPNRDEGILVNDATTTEERQELAMTCALRLEIRMPVVIDGIDDAVCSAYGGFPDRLALVGRGGVLRYLAEEGPWGFRPDDLAAAIESELRRT